MTSALLLKSHADVYKRQDHGNTAQTVSAQPQKILLLDAADRNDRNLYRLADGTYRLRVNVSRLRFGAGRKRSADAQICLLYTSRCV